ncbi:MAG: hypothetical protein HUU20_08500 [Pirellulales bacterium]|nr:hypothetical protein [Pirellulales bacterium]
MTRISVSLSGIERTLVNRLAEADAAVKLHSLRLTTGKKVRTPRDAPSTFLALSGLQSWLGNVKSAVANVAAASSMITKTQTAVAQIRTQLGAIRTELVKDEARSLTPAERSAAQGGIDEAIVQINALAGAEIDGRLLLDGSADYSVSGRDPAQVSSLRVYSTGRATAAGWQPEISGSVLEAATQAQLVYTGSGGKTTAAATFTLTGKLGSAAINVALNEDLDDVATRINDVSHKTGVVASVDGDELTLTSVYYGAAAEVAVSVSDGAFAVTGGNGDGTANGDDAVARINGILYTAGGNGNRLAINQNGFHFDIEFAAGFTGDLETMTVDGGGLTFALLPSLYQRSGLAVPGLHAASLGGVSGKLGQIFSGGTYSGLDANTSRAIRIVDEAIGQLDMIGGRIDGYFNASITSSSNLLSEFQEDLEDSIVETDGYNEDEEYLLLEKSQSLADNARTSLSVLYEQRMKMVELIEHLAGLGS